MCEMSMLDRCKTGGAEQCVRCHCESGVTLVEQSCV